MYSLRFSKKKSFCFLHLNKLDYHDSVSTRIHGPASILFQFAFPPKDLNPLFGVYEYNKTGTLIITPALLCCLYALNPSHH